MLGDDGLLALLHRIPVQRAAVNAVDAVLGRMLQVVPQLGIEQQRLGGNAAHVQAGSTQHVHSFDQCSFQSKLSGANRRRVTGWSAAHNRHVVNRLCHKKLRSHRATSRPGRCDDILKFNW